MARKSRKNRKQFSQPRISSPKAAAANTVSTRTIDELGEFFNGNKTHSGARVTPDNALNVAAVYACVRVLAESVAMLPMRLFEETEDGSRKILRNHKLHRLVYKRPNVLMTPLEFKRLMVGTLALRGNFYAQKVAIGTAAQQLLPLHPDRVTPKRGDDGLVVYEVSRGNSQKVMLPQSQVMHIRGLSTDGFMGVSIVKAAAEALGVALKTEEHASRLFSNGAAPGGTLKHPGQLSPEAATRLKASFDEQHSGSHNAGKTILLEEGMQWEKIGMTSDEAQFLESRKFQRSEIAMFFGVPPHMIGDVERGTSWGSGIEQQSLGFVTYTLNAWLVNIAQAFERDLIADEEQDRLEFGFDTEALANIDFNNLQSGLKTQYDAGVLSRDEWRRRNGLNPRHDGKGGFVDEGMRNAA